MELLRFLLRANAWAVAASALVSAVSGVCTIGVLAFIRLAMQAGEPSAWLIWSFVGVCVAALATRFASQSLSISLSRQIGASLTGHLSERILATALARLERLGESRVQAVLTTHAAAIAQGAAAIPTVVAGLAVIAACLVYMAWLSPLVAGCAIAALALGALLQALLLRRGLALRGSAMQTQEDVQVQVRRLLGGVKELKLNGLRRKAFLLESLWPTVQFHQRENARGRLAQGLLGASSRGMLYLLIGFFIFGLPVVMEVDRATLTSYVVAAFFLLIPLQELKQAGSSLVQARASLGLVERLGAELAEARPADETAIEDASADWRMIELVGVEHSYRDDQDENRFRLGPLDLTFRRGELIFLAGGNGSGKTTLAKVLAGLYVPEKGEILVDGVPVTDATREAYRQRFSAVFSDYQVFPSLLGLEESPEYDARAREYLARLQLDRKVRVHKGTFSDVERLSSGQRKRLALLTALLEDRSFYVFDEWAADQDPKFKALFYLEILPELKAQGRTAFVITHDDRYYSSADRLLALEAGRLATVDAAGERAATSSTLEA